MGLLHLDLYSALNEIVPANILFVHYLSVILAQNVFQLVYNMIWLIDCTQNPYKDSDQKFNPLYGF